MTALKPGQRVRVAKSHPGLGFGDATGTVTATNQDGWAFGPFERLHGLVEVAMSGGLDAQFLPDELEVIPQ